jgi:hypothetical protein
MRKIIAQTMAKSKSTIPHAAGIDEADVTHLWPEGWARKGRRRGRFT